MHIQGRGKRAPPLGTMQLWHSERGGKADSMFEGGEIRGRSPVLPLKVLLNSFLQWENQRCLLPHRLIDKYPDSLKKNWEIEICVVTTVSLQHFLCYVIQDFSEGLRTASCKRDKKGSSILLSMSYLHPSSSSAYTSSLLSLVCSRRGGDQRNLQCFAWYYFPLCIFVLGNKHMS